MPNNTLHDSTKIIGKLVIHFLQPKYILALLRVKKEKNSRKSKEKMNANFNK